MLRELENSPPGLLNVSMPVPEAVLGTAFLCKSAQCSLDWSRGNRSSQSRLSESPAASVSCSQ